MPICKLDELRELATEVFIASETSPENAAIVADALVAAEADGLASHGLQRVTYYADQAKTKTVDGLAVPGVSQPAGAVVRVDAKDGFAYPAIKAGLARAAELAAQTGVVAMSVANSHHCGVVGHHVEHLAEQGLIGLAFANTPAAIAPWGGSRALFGTNPIAFASPRKNDAPLVVDFAMSKVARGKIMLAAKEGKPIEPGWALDAEGNSITDAEEALKGTLLPMGDAKGAALVMAVEILCAALSGSHFGFEASSFFDAKGVPPRVGQFFLVLKPDLFSPDYLDRLEVMVRAIVEQPGVRLPGSRRWALREKAQRDGVSIPDPLFKELTARAGASAG
ncbi:MAG: Ldh family oxidoreductase [Rhodospirillales bacterium]